MKTQVYFSVFVAIKILFLCTVQAFGSLSLHLWDRLVLNLLCSWGSNLQGIFIEWQAYHENQVWER